MIGSENPSDPISGQLVHIPYSPKQPLLFLPRIFNSVKLDAQFWSDYGHVCCKLHLIRVKTKLLFI